VSYFSHGDEERPTIGLLIDWLGGRYQSHVWPGIVDAAEERDANLVIFSGRVLNTPQGYLRQSNAIFDLISKQNLDGLVILSGNLCQYVTLQELKAFCDHFLSLPAISTSIEIQNLPSVIVDNQSGMRAVMSHLIEEHGYRRIAFIAGPEVNEEAQQRLAIYKDELACHGIPFDPLLVAPGDFSYEAGKHGVRLFYDERHIKPEAIVAAADTIAMGVMSEALARGLNIPGDVALTGFDDIGEARFLSPTLTTVRQPLYKQSYTATIMLLDRIAGRPIPQKVLLPTQLVTRQSCGCLPRSVYLAGKGEMPNGSPSPNDQWREWVIEVVQDAIEHSFFSHASQELLPVWVAQISDSFLSDLEQSDSNHFIQALDKILHEASGQQSEMGQWQDIISTLRKALLAQILEADKRLRTENLLSQARVLISEAAERVQAYQLQQLQYHSVIESEVDQSVLTTLDIVELKTIISETLPALGIPRGYIVLSAEEKYNPANLFLAFDETGIFHDGNSTPYDPQQSFVPERLLPHNRRYTWVAEALYFQDDQLGFALFEMGSRNGALYATMRRQLSSALKGALLLQEYKLAQARIQSVYKELEVFSYSVSHDLKAPLRAISQLASWIVEDSAPLLDQDGQEKLNMLIDRTQHMHRLIDGILAYSRIGRITEKVSSVDLNVVIADLVSLLDPPATIHITTENLLPVITGEPTHIHQVFQNLLSNAIRYMDKPKGFIRVKSEEMEDGWLISIADNGPGIAEKYHEKIFQMFQTLGTPKDEDSTGIGLALVKRIIEKWGGVIWVESKEGQGCTFFFTIPKIRREA